MIYRQEHPDPQWERSTWKNLNGQWEFDFDFSDTAIERELYKAASLPKKITVPFCPESELSGIGYRDFMPAVCYRRTVELSETELTGRVLLHFGAVDYESYIYINGELAGKHLGGYASFTLDITKLVRMGENTIFVIARDDVRSAQQPAGKQSNRHDSWGCFYTRTTGIWQTVWLEFVPESYVKKVKYYPDPINGTLTVLGQVCGSGQISIAASYEGKPMGSASAQVFGGQFMLQLKLEELHLWEPGQGRLYDLEISFGEDRIRSYFGLRSAYLEGKAFKLNGKTLFLRTVLDQGYYPDGLYTAKSDEDMKRDIEISMAAGFNSARLHQEVFEKRFLYHCDRAGYLVWGEHANWGMDFYDVHATEVFLNEWMEIVDRDFNHPAIIGWCPFNETGYVETRGNNTLITTVFNYTKRIDTTRVCIDSSGWVHNADTDIYDVHDYDQVPESFKAKYDRLVTEGYLVDWYRDQYMKDAPEYKGQPVFMSEYGGIQWNTDGNTGWGYGQAPQSEEEFIARYKGLTDALLDNPMLMGFCYTQLYDIEQEINGLYTYDRKPKFDVEIFKKINSRKTS